MKEIISADYQKITENHKSDLSYTAIENFGRQIAETYSFDPMKNLVRDLAVKIGASIVTTDSNNHLQGSLEGGSVFIHGPGDFTIYLLHSTDVLRDNFTIGHELGHYYLHSKEGTSRLYATRFGSEPVEWQANRFAASLLMPSEAFMDIASDTGHKISILAGTFNVSYKAAEARLDSLS